MLRSTLFSMFFSQLSATPQTVNCSHQPILAGTKATGRSPGSQVLTRRLPGFTQWPCDAPALAYRCGGSRGIAAPCATHPVPVSPVANCHRHLLRIVRPNFWSRCRPNTA